MTKLLLKDASNGQAARQYSRCRGSQRRGAQSGAGAPARRRRCEPAAVAAVQRDGTCWLGGTTWNGEYVLRVSISNWATTDEDVDRSAAASPLQSRHSQLRTAEPISVVAWPEHPRSPSLRERRSAVRAAFRPGHLATALACPSDRAEGSRCRSRRGFWVIRTASAQPTRCHNDVFASNSDIGRLRSAKQPMT